MHAWIASVALLATASIVVADGDFTRQWVVHIRGGRSIADKVALDHGFDNLGEIFEDYYHFSHPRIVRRSTSPHHERRILLAVDTRVTWAQQQRAKRRTKRDYRMDYSDPRWPNMWYLNRGQGLDMNVIPAWQEGVTGKGAVVTILDDGLEKDHPDLIQNYDPLASYDVNNQDSDPSPRYDMIDSNRHGTRCAGEVAATSNNSICSLGVAHGAQVGGVRMLDGDVTDAVEARSLSLNPQHIDIYSASWGPDDDGKTVDGPGELATRAFIEGVTKGRNGKGSIFIWASGNGGRDHDNCNCDGYTNSIYSLSISSATEHGRVPWYSEACSSTLATTYSSGEVGERQVITTDLHHACTSSHTGTSASAPLAAGICALALESNPLLTWRDMQHIVVRTARPQRLIAHDWQTNGVGRNVSHSFGYGLMDAYAMVQLARKWITVPEQHSYEIKAPQTDRKIPSRSVVVLSLTVTDAGDVKILEHVQAKLTISAQKRGDLNIQLISPMGTRVTLLAHRIHDSSHSGFSHWPFMSVHSWGETPLGTWTLEVHNDGRFLADVRDWDLILYGTTTPPAVDRVGKPDTGQVHSSFVHPDDINENVIDPDEDLKVTPEIRKDLLDEEYVQQAMNGCKQSRGSVCIVCEDGFFFFDNACVEKCPETFYAVKYTEYNYDPETAPAIYACEPCHYSCKACVSSNDNACTACHPDAFLHIRTLNESYCYPNTVRAALIEEEWCFRMFVVLVIILGLGAIFSVIWCIKKARKDARNRKDIFMKMDSLMNIRDIERKVKSAVYSDSE